MKKLFLLAAHSLLLTAFLNAQEKKLFTHADTLRGSITPERAWWDVLRYDITVKPDYESRTIEGSVDINFRYDKAGTQTMQIDLQNPLVIDSVLYQTKPLAFSKIKSNVWYLKFKIDSKEIKTSTVAIFYHGKPREAIKPPWDGGWIWKKDKQGRAWMSVACQGLGASVW